VFHDQKQLILLNAKVLSIQNQKLMFDPLQFNLLKTIKWMKHSFQSQNQMKI